MEFEKNIIYIDSREKHRIKSFIKYVENNPKYINDNKYCGLKPIYEKIKKDEKWYEIRPLEYGDYIYNDCIFEYKTEQDFIESSRHGDGGSTRLNTQMDECNRLAKQKHVFAVIEGDYYNLQPEYRIRLQYKAILIDGRTQNQCFKNMLYAIKTAEDFEYSPTSNYKKLPEGVGFLLAMDFSKAQAKAINKKYRFRDINDFKNVFNQTFESFKKESKVKYLNEEIYTFTQRWLGL